jgi:hypothetical protein
LTKVFFLALCVAAVAAFAQDPPPAVASRTGTFALNRLSISLPFGPLGTIFSTSDSFSGSFVFTDFSQVAIPQPPTATTIGQCVVTPNTQPPDLSSASTTLDAGGVINLTGPNGTRTFGSTQFGFSGSLGGGPAFAGQPPPVPLYLDPGYYSIDNGGGGADVGAFATTITIPNALVWTNADAAQSLSINRAAGVDVTWTGGDPNTRIQINGGVLVVDAATLQVSGGASFACTEDNAAGHFFVSPDVLSLLPASSMRTGISNGQLSVGSTVAAPFSAPGLDAGTFTYSAVTNRNPAYY